MVGDIMRLRTVMKLIKNQFMVDEELRAYKYDDRIELYEYISPIDKDGKRILNEMECKLMILYYNKNNVITSIEHSCLSLINERNMCLYKCLIKLVGEIIIDLDKYKYVDEYMFPYTI